MGDLPLSGHQSKAMPTPTVDPSCSSRWKFAQASATPIASGFYTFDYDPTHQLAMSLFGVGVVDSTLPLTNGGISTLAYYDSECGVLYSLGCQ
jgi:hypothetical protein